MWKQTRCPPAQTQNHLGKRTSLPSHGTRYPRRTDSGGVPRNRTPRRTFEVQCVIAVNGFFGIIGNLAAVFPLTENEVRHVLRPFQKHIEADHSVVDGTRSLLP